MLLVVAMMESQICPYLESEPEWSSHHFGISLSLLSPQGVTHQQWYLFNDFLIEPIDKVSCNTFHSFNLPLY